MRKNQNSQLRPDPARKKNKAGKKPAGTVAVPRILFLLLAALLILAAGFLRYQGAQNDLWLDEFWSLALAKTVTSPVAIFTSIHHDNNHYLNTLWMVLLPDRGNWWGYRIPSILAGLGTVVLSGLIGNRRGRINALILMLLTTFSFFLVMYSSEARGYSEEVFFAFLSFFIMDRFIGTKKPWLGFLYSASILLAVLSHLASVMFFLVMIGWSAYRLFPQRSSFKQFALHMLYCHAVPTLFMAWLYMVDLRIQTTGGGRTEFSLTGTFMEALSWACGGHGKTAMAICLTAIGILSLVYGLRNEWRLQSNSWFFPVCAAIFFPLLFVLAFPQPSVYVRHFIISMAFVLVLISIYLTSLFERSRTGKAICISLLAAFLGANAWQTRNFFLFGRGSYTEAIRYIEQNSSGKEITVSGDHPFRIPATLSFYTSLIKMQKDIRYFNIGEWPAGGPEWLILHKPPEDDSPAAPPRESEIAGIRYILEKDYPASQFSGLHWFLYHRR
jgi:hypothetical protein